MKETGWVKYADQKPPVDGWYLYAGLPDGKFHVAYWSKEGGWADRPGVGSFGCQRIGFVDPVFWRLVIGPICDSK